MVTDFSGTSILSNEFVVICRASTDNLGYFWVRVPNVATGGKKWFNELIIYVWSNVKIG